MAGTNLTSEIYERAYGIYRDQSQPPLWFRHTPVTYSGPTLIVYPGTLNAIEQAEVNGWLIASDSDKPRALLRCTQRLAIAKIAEYVTYYATASYLNWRDTDAAARVVQWKYFMADAMIASKATVSKSNDAAGSGSGEIATPLTAGDNV